MLTLLVLCHQCGREFASEVSLGADGVHGPLSDGVLYSCPHCGTRDPYFTAEHHLPGARGFAASRSSGTRWWGAGRLSAFLVPRAMGPVGTAGDGRPLVA